MGKAIITLLTDLGEVPALKDIRAKVRIAGSVPEFGAKNHQTMVVRDEADPTKIIGYALIEFTVQVREIVTDPDHPLKAPILSHLFTVLDSRWRCGDLGDYDRYYVSIDRSQPYVEKFYKEEGAIAVDSNCNRYMKKKD